MLEGPVYWLVDLENTGSRWTSAANLFRSGDTVVFFWSSKSCDVAMKALPNAPWLRYMFVQCSNGTLNALDFQLCAWLGHMSAQEPGTSFAILSFDHGYKPLEQFMDYCFNTRVILVDPTNKALGQAGVTLKSGMVAKACNAVVIAQACAGQEAQEDSLRKSIARIFPAGQSQNAWAVLSTYLKAKL